MFMCQECGCNTSVVIMKWCETGCSGFVQEADMQLDYLGSDECICVI